MTDAMSSMRSCMFFRTESLSLPYDASSGEAPDNIMYSFTLRSNVPPTCRATTCITITPCAEGQHVAGWSLRGGRWHWATCWPRLA